jgi:Na+-driven multidrug efflux pump
MGDISRDRRSTDESVRNSVRRHGLVVVSAVVLAFVVCLTNFALGHPGAGVAAVIAGLLAFGAGLAWLAMDSRRVRQRDRFRNHSAW